MIYILRYLNPRRERMLRNRKQGRTVWVAWILRSAFLYHSWHSLYGSLASWSVLLSTSSLPRFHLLLQFWLDLTFWLQSLQQQVAYSHYPQPHTHFSQENLIGPNSKVESSLSLKEFKQRQVSHQSTWRESSSFGMKIWPPGSFQLCGSSNLSLFKPLFLESIFQNKHRHHYSFFNLCQNICYCHHWKMM